MNGRIIIAMELRHRKLHNLILVMVFDGEIVRFIYGTIAKIGQAFYYIGFYYYDDAVT